MSVIGDFFGFDNNGKPYAIISTDDLKMCGEQLVNWRNGAAHAAALEQRLRRELASNEDWMRDANKRIKTLQSECDLWKNLQHSIQTETEKALVRRVGELQAELLELRTTRKELDLLFETPSARREDDR